MISEHITRYDPSREHDPHGVKSGMEECIDGDWCRFEDAEALQKRIERLKQYHANYVAGHGYADALVLEFKQRIEELEAQNVVIKRMLSHARAYGVCAECGDQSGAWIDGRDREGNAEVVQCQTCVQCKTLGIREVTDNE